LKRPLKEFNKLHFNHISERVIRAEDELDCHQTIMQNERNNSQLLMQDKELKLKLINLKSVENMFCGQKLKTNFFKEGDKGTRFFHSSMSKKHRRNRIPAIQCPDGVLTNSLDEVGVVFVRYYQELLRTSRHSILIKAMVARNGPCLHDSTHDLLIAPMSNDVVKKALFSIGNEKAHGFDDYSSFFFKRSWNVVGNDFCAEIKDFFVSGELLKQVNHSIITLVPKSSNVTSAIDSRLISCCNIIYKVISKLLAGCLTNVL
jgi:hypothetical protein